MKKEPYVVIVQLQLCKVRRHTAHSLYKPIHWAGQWITRFCKIASIPLKIGQFYRKLRLLLFLAILSFCVSCMGGASTTNEANGAGVTPTNVAMINVDMYDNYYGESNNNLTSPPVWTVPVGADIVAMLTNHGRRNHNWAIVKLGATIPVPYEEGQGGEIILHGIGMVYSNSQTTMTFTAPEAGEYLVICTVSGHYPEMQGRLLVTAPQK